MTGKENKLFAQGPVINSCSIIIQVEESRGNKMSFSNQEFEECDAFPEDIEYIFRLDVKTGEVTHKVRLLILE